MATNSTEYINGNDDDDDDNDNDDADSYKRNNFDSDVDSVDYVRTDDDAVEYISSNNNNHHHTNKSASQARIAMTRLAQEFMQSRNPHEPLFDRTSYISIADKSEEMSEIATIPQHPSSSKTAISDALMPLPLHYDDIERRQLFIDARLVSIVVVGEPCCGKSTWRELINLEQTTSDADSAPDMRVVFEQYIATIGTDLALYNCWSVNLDMIDNIMERIRSPLVPPPHWNDPSQAKYVPYRLQVWEIGGTKRFDGFASTLFPKASIIFIMLDATNPQCLRTFTGWLKEIDTYGNQQPHQLTIVVGLNKTLSAPTTAKPVDKAAIMTHLQTWPRSGSITQVHYFETDFVNQPADASRLFRFITRDLIEPRLLKIKINNNNNDKTQSTSNMAEITNDDAANSVAGINSKKKTCARCQII